MTDEDRLLEQAETRRLARALEAREGAPQRNAQAVLRGAGLVPARRPLTDAEVAEMQRRLEQETERAAQREREQRLAPPAVGAWLAQAGVPPRHRKIAFREELIPEPVREWSRLLPRIEGSAILSGPPGAGKTAAACWLLRAAYCSGAVTIDVQPWHERSPVRVLGWDCPSARFVSASDLFAQVFLKQPLEPFERPQLLVIDDWGMAYESEWPLAVLDALIDRRWSSERTTIVTTNLKGAREEGSFEKRYPRVFSRLCDAEGPGLVMLVREDLRRAAR